MTKVIAKRGLARWGFAQRDVNLPDESAYSVFVAAVNAARKEGGHSHA